MDSKQKVLLSIAIVAIISFIMIIILGDNGFLDLNQLKDENTRLIEQNQNIISKNQTLYREVDRLKHDLQFLENVARQELGMIKEDEIIFKFKTTPNIESKDK